MFIRKSAVVLAAGVLLVALSACATDITRNADAVQLAPDGDGTASIHLVKEVRVRFSQGQATGRLKGNSNWDAVGAVAQGTVYRPLDTVFQLQAGNAYEAYPVVSDGRVVGAYLPVQGVFIPARRPIAVEMEEIR